MRVQCSGYFIQRYEQPRFRSVVMAAIPASILEKTDLDPPLCIPNANFRHLEYVIMGVGVSECPSYFRGGAAAAFVVPAECLIWRWRACGC